jgi:DHA1 family multidrug resistance protein-like MFS transporter
VSESDQSGRLVSLAARLPWFRGLPREVGVLAAIAFCVALGFGIVAPALPVFARTFGVSAFLAAAVISVFAFMRLLTAPVAGGLVNRIGERAVLSAGLIIVAVSSLLAGFSQTYPQLLLLRGVGGIGSAMFTVSAMALLLRTAGPNQRGRASSAFQAGFLFGGITGPAVGGIVVGISIRMPFFVYAATLAAAAVVAIMFLRSPEQILAEQEAQRPSGEQSESERALADASSTPDNKDSSTEHVTLLAALRNGAYRAALMANLVNGFVTFGIRTSLVPLFVVESLMRGPGLAGVGFLVAAAAQGGALIFAGRITDQRGRKPALTIGIATTLVGVLVLTLANDPVVFVIAMGVTGIGTAFLGSAPAAIVGDVMGKQRGGTVVAAFQMIADVGAIAGPLIAGLIVDQLGYHWAFATAVVVCAFALLVAVTMPETIKRETPAQT